MLSDGLDHYAYARLCASGAVWFVCIVISVEDCVDVYDGKTYRDDLYLHFGPYSMLVPFSNWEFDVLGVYNFRRPGKLDPLIEFLRAHHSDIDGDIVEAGVFRGNTLIALGLLLKEIGSTKKVFGFDSFSGFPPVYHPYDDVETFATLFASGRISNVHMQAVRNNLLWRAELDGNGVESASAMSSSGAFTSTSLALVERKISLIGLDNIELVPGAFSETMNSPALPKKVMAAVMDCDLYQSYLQVFEFLWPRLSVGAMVHLDEYFSLKFPGARIATDEFLTGKSARLEMAPRLEGDFERWHVLKER